jgi:SlyX protein
MDATDDRIIRLEMRATEQERTIEELSTQIAEQWKVIDRLNKQVGLLAEQFLTLEEQVRPEIPVTRPPHW